MSCQGHGPSTAEGTKTPARRHQSTAAQTPCTPPKSPPGSPGLSRPPSPPYVRGAASPQLAEVDGDVLVPLVDGRERGALDLGGVALVRGAVADRVLLL